MGGDNPPESQGLDPKPGELPMARLKRGASTTLRRAGPTNVAKLGDELWVEVKCQANLDIAGSPRNSSRASVRGSVAGVEQPDWVGGQEPAEPNRTPNAATPHPGSQTVRQNFIVERGITQTAS